MTGILFFLSGTNRLSAKDTIESCLTIPTGSKPSAEMTALRLRTFSGLSISNPVGIVAPPPVRTAMRPIREPEANSRLSTDSLLAGETLLPLPQA